MPNFQLFPLPFWLVVAMTFFFAIRAWRQPESALRLPMFIVLLTVGAWYIGDVLYNDYSEYLLEIDETSLEYAWWEVLSFICTFGLLAPPIHRMVNRKHLGKPSNLLSLMYYGGLKSNKFQEQLDSICHFLVILWTFLMIVALIRVNFDFVGLFMPYFSARADPWVRGRVGSGYDFLVAFASYFQIGLVAGFGVIAALAYRPLTLTISLAVWFLTLPSYIFDRTRSAILATLLPGFLAWVFLRLRSGLLVKAVILAIGFLVIQSWMKFIIENRTDSSISLAFSRAINNQSMRQSHSLTTFSQEDPASTASIGFNMFEELGFVNLYISNGTIHPDLGEEYFAELVNPIPRSIWPGKPLIGIDYAVARGQKLDDSADDSAGVGATISTGMIGQGIVNFGLILGPPAAALLMSFWAAVLARQDLLAADPGRMFLYVIGLILTFNMGRDISLLVIYPFCFFYLLIVAVKKLQTPKGRPLRPLQSG